MVGFAACPVFCYCLLWLETILCMYMADACFTACSDCVGVCGRFVV